MVWKLTRCIYIEGMAGWQVYDMLEGQKNGMYISYYANGALESKCTYIDNRLQLKIMYHTNGYVCKSVTYDDSGKKHGLYETFHPDASMRSRALFNHGIISGAREFHPLNDSISIALPGIMKTYTPWNDRL